MRHGLLAAPIYFRRLLGRLTIGQAPFQFQDGQNNQSRQCLQGESVLAGQVLRWGVDATPDGVEGKGRSLIAGVGIASRPAIVRFLIVYPVLTMLGRGDRGRDRAVGLPDRCS
jgi:hypothetical protein